MYTLLGGVEAVRVLAPRDEGRGLEPRLLALARLDHLDLEPAPLREADQHAQQHLGPVLRVGSSCAGVDGDDRVAGVVAASEEPLELEIRQARRDALALLGELVLERLVLGRHLLERLEVVDVALELAVGLQLALGARMLRRDLRGLLLVVPEAGLAHLVFERAEALAQRSGVKDSPRAAAAGRGANGYPSHWNSWGSEATTLPFVPSLALPFTLPARLVAQALDDLHA